MPNSLDQNELDKFAKIAEEWWNPNGKFKILHKFNPVRVRYIAEQILKIKKLNSLENLKILDIGCGGGLISEAFSKLGAEVTAIDPLEKNINIAKTQQKKSKSTVKYQHSTIENFDKKQKFDVILCLEVIEHVANPQEFLQEIAKSLNDQGMLFVATINRTVKSLLFAKFAAEYVLNWIPKNTHDWRKFLKPSEINNYITDGYGLKLDNISGFTYNIITNSWNISKDIDQNYIMCYSHG